MKTAVNNGERVIVIRTHDELMSYLEQQKYLLELDFKTLVKNCIPPPGWDHYTSLCAPAIHHAAVFSIKMFKCNAINAHSTALRDFTKIMFATFDHCDTTGLVLVINLKGGYHTCRPEELNDFQEYVSSVPNSVHIATNCSWMILENDAELDPWTVENVTLPCYSYVTNLRRQDLDAVLNSIDEDPREPRTLFVYTTGMDYHQMENYTTVAINSGYKRFIFVASTNLHSSFFKIKELILSINFGLVVELYEKDDPAWKS